MASEVAIKVTTVHRSDGGEHYFADLCYRGKSFRVPDVTRPWPAADWPTHLDAMRAADCYRAQWEPPTDEVMAYMEKRATEVSI